MEYYKIIVVDCKVIFIDFNLIGRDFLIFLYVVKLYIYIFICIKISLIWGFRINKVYK